ncbi:MAG: carboxypeptidase regulatory-like domain-containing protein [Capsulimonadaceae bacterium]|nr:carboxypeptidase regulatory-like domain-containing protein [Capsulimonadaceae bacterium]
MKLFIADRKRSPIKLAVAILVLSAATLLAGCGGGGGGNSGSNVVTVNGKVADKLTSKPLASRVVSLSGTSFSATTDASGAFSFAGVTTGTYTLVIKDSLGSTDGAVAVDVSGANGAADDLGTISIDTSGTPPPPPLVRAGK